MRKVQMGFWRFVILTVIVIFSMTGCATLFPPPPEFPQELIGTWQREDSSRFTSTRTFTARTFQQSEQPYHWILVGVSGDRYTIALSTNRLIRTIKDFRIVNDKLIISECQGSYNDHDSYCNGTWIR